MGFDTAAFAERGGAAIQGALRSRPVVSRNGVFFWCLRTLVSCVTGFAGLLAGPLAGLTWLGLICAVFAFDNLQRMRGLPSVQLPR